MFPTVYKKTQLMLVILLNILVQNNTEKVTDFTTAINSTPNRCKSTMTTVNGAHAHCSGQIIFEDDFNGKVLDSNKWSSEHRLPQQPDYEFNMYLNNVDNVLQLNNGSLIIKPKATNEHFDSDIMRRTFSLGSSCTGRLETEECVFHPRTFNKLKPLITAQIKTKDKFAFRYGRVEIKAKMPAAMWVYPQLWLEPDKPKYGDFNYYSGQMRIGQTIANGDDITLSGGLVLNSKEPWRSLKICQHINKSLNLAEEFHLYQLIWQPNFIVVAVDDQEYCRITIANDEEAFKNLEISGQQLPNRQLLFDSSSTWAPFDQEFFLTLGYGVGGHGDFRDDVTWVEDKPWQNIHPRSKNLFWNKYKNHLSNWLTKSDLVIDYVKVYAI